MWEKSGKVILLNCQNNYAERSNWLLECQNFLFISIIYYTSISYIIILIVQHNYYFIDLYLLKFFNI